MEDEGKERGGRRRKRTLKVPENSLKELFLYFIFDLEHVKAYVNKRGKGWICMKKKMLEIFCVQERKRRRKGKQEKKENYKKMFDVAALINRSCGSRCRGIS